MNENQRNELIVRRTAEGVSLSDIQKELENNHQIVMTYMDLRMLVADLEEIQWKKEEVEEPEAEEEVQEALDPKDEIEVNISSIVRPGCVLSGDVTFRSGINADWYVDQYGRLGMDPKGEDTPTESELQEFQQALQMQVAQRGMG